MKILKKRISSTAIVMLGAKLYTREGVTDEIWIKILEKCDALTTSEEGSDVYALTLQTLISLLDPKIVFEETKKKQVFNEKVASGLIDPDKNSRMRAAIRIADISGIFEYDGDGFVYLKGFSHPMPKLLTEAILESHYNPNSRYTLNSLVNFWKYLILNPDKHVRDSLFSWIKTSKFSITEEGNIIAYRNVDVKHQGYNDIRDKFVLESFTKVKKWKKSVKNYSIALENNTNKYKLVHGDTAEDGYRIVGKLDVLFNKIFESNDDTIYTDNYTKTMEIRINKPVSMKRSDCDNDPNSSCSRGLHNKSAAYSLDLGTEVLVTLVNPYNVVAIPTYDNTKFRSCEYLPVSRAEIVDNKLVEFEPGTYDIAYNGLNSILKSLSSKSIEDLKACGEISEDISKEDMNAIIEFASKLVETRVIKVQ